MKNILLLLLITTFGTSSYAQVSNRNLLSPEIFDKMIINDVAYAIFGESNPVNGVKMDISKPEATVSGVFNVKKEPWILFGFDFKGGITDKNFSVLKGTNSFNTAFELRPNFHFIPSLNSAWYNAEDTSIVRVKNELVDQRASAVEDTFLVVATIYNRHLANFRELLDTSAPVRQFLLNVDSTQKPLLIQMISRLTLQGMGRLNHRSPIDSILGRVNSAQRLADSRIDVNTYDDNIINAYKKYKKKLDEIPNARIMSQIQNSNSVWTKKSLIWFTLSPFVRAENINFYHTKFEGADSLYFKREYPVFYGIGGSTNFLWLYPDRHAHFLKLGINVSHSNNIASLTSFNYETRTSFFSYPNNITEKTKSGSAYNYSNFKQGLLSQVSFEYYYLPLNKIIPGFYYSGSMNVSDLYKLPTIEGRVQDVFSASMEGGLVFNINSREKDKERNLLSILVYARFEDITDSRRTSISTEIEESKDDFYKRNLGMGIKVGIPINLPQKGK